ncbi:MAG: DUF5674 family protein [Patescibacteria group bacterium]|jgi:hypothetical protein
MEIKIIKEKISLSEVKQAAEESYGDMVKAVVDIKKEIFALGGDLHADAEEILLQAGSDQHDLWGINLYPENSRQDLIIFSSLINISPKRENRSMMIEIPEVKEKIRKIIDNLVI